MADRTPRIRYMSLSLLICMVSASLAYLTFSGDGTLEPPSRAATYYLSKDDIYFPAEFQEDEMWAVAFLQNQDYVRDKASNSGDYIFNYRDVANSFAIKLDGTQQSSGSSRRVLVELFTATDCVFCPGAEESLDIIATEMFPQNISLIEWHRALNPGADPYETGASGNRFIYYNVSGTPTAFTDGKWAYVGGDSSATSPQLVAIYKGGIARSQTEPAMVSLSGSGRIVGDYLDFNVSFSPLGPMPKGNWTFSVAICEDLQKDDNGATMRHTPRWLYSRAVPELQEGFPDISFDIVSTFQGIDRERVRENLTIRWSAGDTEDGKNIMVDILLKQTGGDWQKLAEDLPNTGSFKWDTMGPRVPDGEYQMRLVATDRSGNAVLSREVASFTIDNKDLPVASMVYPKSGDSLSGRPTVRWDSSDDEDAQLMVKISLSNDTGLTWKVLSYDPKTQDDYIPDTGMFEFNTGAYEDKATYRIRLDFVDSDLMRITVVSELFEIYNNDAPEIWIISPEMDEVVSGELSIEWKVVDQEDTPSSINGNFSVKKGDSSEWQVLYLGLLDDAMAPKVFDTSELQGDGDYLLTFTAIDSRGLSVSDDRRFKVYDPDMPVFSFFTGPSDLSDIRSDTMKLDWNCSDPDAGETLTYSISISPAEEGNWTLVAQGLAARSYDLALSSRKEGSYMVKVTAVDSSPLHLAKESVLGPFYYNAPDPPVVLFTYPPAGFNGTIEDKSGTANETGVFNIELLWTASDKDGDSLSFDLSYKGSSDTDWRPLATELDTFTFTWNVTKLKSGAYQLKLVARDGSAKHLAGESILGPFQYKNPFEGPDDDDDTGPDDDLGPGEDDGPNMGLLLIIAFGSVFVVLIVVGLVLLLVSRTGSKEPMPAVMPAPGQVDLSIPDFDREAAPPIRSYSGYQVSQGPYAGLSQPPQPQQPQPEPPVIGGQMPVDIQGPPPPPPPVITDQKVSWEEAPPATPEAPAVPQEAEPQATAPTPTIEGQQPSQ